mmetsp:Transcript_58765/g.127658  ORF Transcript_58765/g.127658 Transcript_58765/m.127658 type:complete len:297 (-) Transcript_58765:703-1593(-)
MRSICWREPLVVSECAADAAPGVSKECLYVQRHELEQARAEVMREGMEHRLREFDECNFRDGHRSQLSSLSRPPISSSRPSALLVPDPHEDDAQSCVERDGTSHASQAVSDTLAVRERLSRLALSGSPPAKTPSPTRFYPSIHSAGTSSSGDASAGKPSHSCPAPEACPSSQPSDGRDTSAPPPSKIPTVGALPYGPPASRSPAFGIRSTGSAAAGISHSGLPPSGLHLPGGPPFKSAYSTPYNTAHSTPYSTAHSTPYNAAHNSHKRCLPDDTAPTAAQIALRNRAAAVMWRPPR